MECICLYSETYKTDITNLTEGYYWENQSENLRAAITVGVDNIETGAFSDCPNEF